MAAADDAILAIPRAASVSLLVPSSSVESGTSSLSSTGDPALPFLLSPLAAAVGFFAFAVAAFVVAFAFAFAFAVAVAIAGPPPQPPPPPPASPVEVLPQPHLVMLGGPLIILAKKKCSKCHF